MNNLEDWARFQILFHLGACPNYSITNYVKIPVLHFFEKVNKGQLKRVQVKKTDFAFNQFSISTECCFEILKKVEMVKFTPILFRFPTLNKKNLAKFSIPPTGGPPPSLNAIEKFYSYLAKNPSTSYYNIKVTDVSWWTLIRLWWLYCIGEGSFIEDQRDADIPTK